LAAQPAAPLLTQLRITGDSALNLDFSEWGEAFPNRLLGAATLDRLRHNAYRVVLEGESYRRPKPLPGQPTATHLGTEAKSPPGKGLRKQISVKGGE